MIFTHKTDICEKLKLTYSQGQEVEGQGLICNYTTTKPIRRISRNHERMIGYSYVT